MTVISFLSSRPKEEEKSNLKGEQPNDAEAAATEGKKEPQVWSSWEVFYNFSKVILGVFMLVLFVTFPMPSPNPYPQRLVHLNKTNGSYGLVIERDEIADMAIDGSAHLTGQLARNDKIIAVNGVNVTSLRCWTDIPLLMETRDDDVKLIVVAKYQEPLPQRFLTALPFALIFSTIITCIIILLVLAAQYDEEQPVECLREVTLTKTDDEMPYGFAHHGSRIVKVFPGSPADVQGGLKKGETIVILNGVSLLGLPMQTITEITKTRKNEMRLTVRSKIE